MRKDPFTFRHWSKALVVLAQEEVDAAVDRGKNGHPWPKTLTIHGERVWRIRWPELLKEALARQTPRWLGRRLFAEGIVRDEVNAALIAEQHFKRFYNIAICLLAAEAKKKVWYYRARESKAPGWETDELLRTQIGEDPTAPLEGLRDLDLFHRMPSGKYRSTLALTWTEPSSGNEW